jgi:undecaprenyl-diphosphatase
LEGLVESNRSRPQRRFDQGWQTFWFLVAASIPGAAIGFVLEDAAETIFRTPLLIAIMLILMGLLLHWADRRGRKEMNLDKIDLKTSLLIGLSQALAIIPGVSRSGITMATGLMLGLKREDTARFSFLLSTPIILGAGLVKTPKLLADPAMINVNFLAGMLISAVVGLLSIGFLLRYVQTKDFRPFAWYRFALGALVIVVALMR